MTTFEIGLIAALELIGKNLGRLADATDHVSDSLDTIGGFSDLDLKPVAHALKGIAEVIEAHTNG